jgi:hypothetical protein
LGLLGRSVRRIGGVSEQKEEEELAFMTEGKPRGEGRGIALYPNGLLVELPPCCCCWLNDWEDWG